DDAARDGRIDGEVGAAGDVRTRQVQLQRRQARLAGQHGGHVDELVLVLAGDVGDDGGRQRAQVGQVGGGEGVDAVVVEADGVEHAGRRLDGARRRVADARLARHRLGHDAAEAGEVDRAGHLARVAERARRHQDRVAQGQATEADGQVDHGATYA